VSETAVNASRAAPRDRSIRARRAARLLKAGREGRIVQFLNGGVSVAEIAAREGVTEKRMRAVIRDILARRAPKPPAEFLAIQVSRLHEALLVAYSAMTGCNLQAVDRVVKIVRELDRYHGFVAAERRYPLGEPRSKRPLKARSRSGRRRSPAQKRRRKPLKWFNPRPDLARLCAVRTREGRTGKIAKPPRPTRRPAMGSRSRPRH